MTTPHMGPQMVAYFLIYLVAMVFFGLEGTGIPSPTRCRWLGWGLFLFLLSMLIRPT